MPPAAEPGPRDDRAAPERRISWRVWVLVVIGLLVVLFGVDNRQSVRVGYLFDESDIPLVWVILISLVAGAAFERAYGFVRRRRDS